MNSTESKQQITGIIKQILYHNNDNGFSVFKLKTKTEDTLHTITGNVIELSLNEIVTCDGAWVQHTDYGLQFKATHIEKKHPESIADLITYLSSGLIKGIGLKTATLLVRTFKHEIFEILDHAPQKLLKIKGLGQQKVQGIIDSWEKQKHNKKMMLFLQSHGLTVNKSIQIIKIYQLDTINKITENPYCLTQDIEGIGFKIADALAVKIGIKPEAPQRLIAGIFHTIALHVSQGHCMIEQESLIEKSIQLLQVPQQLIANTLEDQITQNQLKREVFHDRSMILPLWTYKTEIGIASEIKRLLENSLPIWKHIDSEAAMQWLAKDYNIQLSHSQKTAVSKIINAKISCITGGPGVGKTTVINSITKILQHYSKPIITLCAPTGRAAKKLEESTTIPAKTIHRLLNFSPIDNSFNKNSENQLATHLVIIDEASMIDIHLMYSLLKAIPSHAALIIIGDVDQLPSLGPGKILADFIDSQIIDTFHLTEIFRQAKASQIILNSHRINQGLPPKLTKHADKKTDFYIIYNENGYFAMLTMLNTLLTERLPKAFNFYSQKEVQILSPMYKGTLGVHQLNKSLQKLLNPNAQQHLIKGDSLFQTGDKVIQTINNYEKEVFNGDLGWIKTIDEHEKKLVISFEDDREIQYTYEELGELDLAYAISIHKSQGSEYPVVIILLCMQHYVMLERNLLYTAVSRGKQLVIILCEQKSLKYAIKNHKNHKRLTMLSERLKAIKTTNPSM